MTIIDQRCPTGSGSPTSRCRTSSWSGSRRRAPRRGGLGGLRRGRGQDTANAKLCRVEVPRDAWRKVTDGLKGHLNRRLKEKGLKVCRFATGDNRVERILGRELMVLAWAIEDATADEAAIAFTRWSSHRPEELWWLFQQIDRDGGEWDSRGPAGAWRSGTR